MQSTQKRLPHCVRLSIKHEKSSSAGQCFLWLTLKCPWANTVNSSWWDPTVPRLTRPLKRWIPNNKTEKKTLLVGEFLNNPYIHTQGSAKCRPAHQELFGHVWCNVLYRNLTISWLKLFLTHTLNSPNHNSAGYSGSLLKEPGIRTSSLPIIWRPAPPPEPQPLHLKLTPSVN